MTAQNDPGTPAYYVEIMLRSSVEADRLAAERINDRWFLEAHTHTAVNGFIAAMAMEMLRRHNPDIARDVAEHIDEITTAGDLGGPAYRTAQAVGLDPDQWIREFNERAASRKAKAA